MSNATEQPLPITSFIPIANAKQQLVALSICSPNISWQTCLALLQHLERTQFFSQIAPLVVVLDIDDLGVLSTDVLSLLSRQKLSVRLSINACSDPQAREQLNVLDKTGISVFVQVDSTTLSVLNHAPVALCWDASGELPASVRMVVGTESTRTHWAAHLNTLAKLNAAQSAGFTLLSGQYAYAVVPSHQVNDGGARIRVLKLLGLVSRDAESSELEELIKQDTALSFMLFKLVSSAAFTRPVVVTSFAQAINLLGRRQLQRWLQLLLYARHKHAIGALNPLMLRAAFRASMMEAISKIWGVQKAQRESAFMVGMFSLLDILFGCSLREILQPLSLESEVIEALLHRHGDLGAALELVESLDRQDVPLSPELLASVGLPADAYYACIVEAYTWVAHVCQEM